MRRELPEQEGLYLRQVRKSVNAMTGQILGDALEGTEVLDRSRIREVLEWPEWIDETVAEQLADGSEVFMLDFDGLDSGISLL